jgi:hypothetical protein
MTRTTQTAYIDQFSNVIHDLVEQKLSLLINTISREVANGEKHFFDRLGDLLVKPVTTVNTPIDLQDAAHSRRMATVTQYGGSVTLSDFDKLKMVIDPTSDYAMKLASAHARNLDDVVYEAMLGAAATGRTGSGSTPFDIANQRILDGGSGFTVSKFNEALRFEESNEVDVDRTRLYLAIGARAVQDLLDDSSNHFTSFDFQGEKALSTGRLPSFRGVNIIRSQRVPDEVKNVTFRGIMYTEDTIKMAIAQNLKMSIDTRYDLEGLPLQVSSYMMMGAVRMEEKTIVDILYV